jgi:cell division inhibitor SepF
MQSAAATSDGLVGQVVHFFKSFFSFESETSETSHFINNKKPRPAATGKVHYIRGAEDAMQGCINIKSPRNMDDARDAADKIREGRVVIMNLAKIEKDIAKEVLYFLGGTVYALGGEYKKVGSDIFLFTPEGVSVAQIDELKDRAVNDGGGNLGFDDL